MRRRITGFMALAALAVLLPGCDNTANQNATANRNANLNANAVATATPTPVANTNSNRAPIGFRMYQIVMRGGEKCGRTIERSGAPAVVTGIDHKALRYTARLRVFAYVFR